MSPKKLNKGEQALAEAVADHSLAAFLAPEDEPDTAAAAAAQRRADGEKMVLLHQSLREMSQAPDKLAGIYGELEKKSAGLSETYKPAIAIQKRDELRQSAHDAALKVLGNYLTEEVQLRRISPAVTAEEFALPKDERHQWQISVALQTAPLVPADVFLGRCRAAVEAGNIPLVRELRPILEGFAETREAYQGERYSAVHETLDLMASSMETSWTHAQKFAGELCDNLRIELRGFVRHLETSYGMPDPTLASAMLARFLETRRAVEAAS